MKRRQDIVDGYLVATGRNMFVPAEFVDWLEGEPEHEAYDWFFGKSDEDAAREYRIGLARRMVSGLRVVANVETTEANVVHITSREFPAYVSPQASRRSGGGYTRFDPDDPEAVAELQRQGRVALQSWLDRYAGAFVGQDLSAMEEIVRGDADVAQPA